MTPVELAPGGPALSPVVAGTWRLGGWGWSAAACAAWIAQCVDLGVTSFDLADVYGDYAVEGLFGAALAASPGLRERIQLVTKCGIRLVSPGRPAHRIKHYDTSAAHIVASVEASLRALGTDRIELLLIHRPDPLLDADEVAGAFESLRAAGKVLHAGVSNFTPSQFALLAGRTRLATNQIELHPLRLDPLADGTLDQLQAARLRPMVWSPLAGGALLTGGDARAARVRDALETVAAARGVAAAAVAYAWLFALPSRPLPITGTRRIEALREALAGREIALGRDEWTRIWCASTGHDVP